jgi:signal transduction histidine kinase/ligand-binding sensor domain-containing protein
VRSVVFLAITSVAWAASAAAQSISPNIVFGTYQQIHWQERDGLPLNTVLAVVPTSDGYLWLGTYGGAVRFDGVRFTLFNPSNTPGIGDAVMSSIMEARNGDLWLGTFGGGVSRLSGGRFTAYGVKDGLSSNYAKSLLEDRAGTIWIATEDGGVNSFRDGRFTAYTVANGLPSDTARALLEDRDGALLVGTSAGIARIAAGRVTPFAGPATSIQTMVRAHDGAIWAAGVSGGLYRIDAAGVTTTFGPAQGLTNTTVESLCADDAGAVWIGNYEGALFRYAGNRFEAYTPADGLPGERVAAIACRGDKGVWLGTDGGLAQLKVPRFTVYGKREGLANDWVSGIVQDAEGSAWVASTTGLTRFKDGAFRIFTTRDGLPDDYIRDLARGTDGSPLVQTRKGLARWRHDRFVPVDGVADVPLARVTTLMQDRGGTLWFGLLREGLLRVRDGQTTRLRTQEGLADDAVLSLFEDRDGRIWVGTLNGVTVIDRGQMRSWSARDGLPANHVKVFYQDASGTIWIGTHGGGLTRFKNGTFATISARQGLFNDYIFQILDDGNGNLWMNCNAGIWRTSLAQLNEAADGRRAHVDSVAYGTADGMLSSEGVGGTLAGWRMRDGSLWFPTIKGLVVFDPRRRDASPPRVAIERIASDREPMPAGAEVRLAPGRENLEIEYTGLAWDRPRAIKFRYRLIGVDRDWIDAGPRRTAYYSHLEPGSYTFVVTADNGEGVWNQTGQRLSVVVLPRFYQTWWFLVVTAVSLVALVWLSWRYRVNQLQTAQLAFSRQLIESQERERQRIAAELHDSLSQSLLEVKNRAMLGTLTRPNDAACKQFQEIGATAAQTLDEVRTISYNLRPHHLDQLGLTTTIGALVEKMAASSTIRMTSQLDDIDGAFAPVDEITIYRIVQECLNNVVKHAQATEAEVIVRCLEHHAELVIRDNGRGFSVNGPRAASADGRGGFGLKGLAQRIHMLGGTHIIDSAPGRGTTVTARFAVDTQAGARRRA